MKLPGILLVLALAAPALAWGQGPDSPERIARLSYVEGDVTFQPADGRPTSRLPDRPLEPGDRIVTERDGRAELALGTAIIRLDRRSELAIDELDERTVRVALLDGSASVLLNDLLEDEIFEIVTPNSAITLEKPGEYRADVLAEDVSAITVHGGVASVETADGQVRVLAGQRARLEGREVLARLERPLPDDAFDNWVLEREVRLAEAESPRYTPYEGGGGYDQLDRYGDWYDDPYYGRVWTPGYGYSNWSPYYGGYWQQIGFGWNWIDPAPWGYYTYYGGRWTYLRDRNRWGWVPGHRHRPWRWDHDDHDGPYPYPYGYPRHRETPESAPRTANAGSPGIEAPVREATPRMAPRRIAPDRRPTQARENTADERPRGGTYSRGGGNSARGDSRERGNDARGGDRESRPAAPPRDSGATMRPERSERARSESAPDRSSRSKREFGAQREH